MSEAIELLIVIGLPVLCGTIIALVAIVKGKSGRRQEAQDRDDTRTIQELYQRLTKLADRLDALETIILDQERDGATRSKRNQSAGTERPAPPHD
jgi:phage shock protein B